MTIGNELAATIKRLFHAEKWRIHTIATQLHIHHSVVRRVLDQEHQVTMTQIPPTLIDRYLPLILSTLETYPTLTASRLYGMVRERGYRGSESHFRRLIARHRPKPIRNHEAFLRLRTLPGEEMQCDWASFGHHQIGKAKRPLMGFIMVLSYSRRIFLRFFLNARMESFLRGHVAAFEEIGGVPRVILYDNLRSAVLERQGDVIRFNPTLLDFAGHYRFKPKPVALARGNEKGRVERAIRYARDAFFAARTFEDIADLNAQAMAWCRGPTTERPCPEDPSISVQEAFEQERGSLLSLPDNPYPTEERKAVSSGKTPYIRYDLNDYSIPHTHVRKSLTVLSSEDEIQILDGATCIATHPRSYDKGRQIETEAHIKALVQEKRKAHQHRAHDRVVQAIPRGQDFLMAAAEKGYVLPSVLRELNTFLDDYGARALALAIDEALAVGAPHPRNVHLCLERMRQESDRPPRIPIPLGDKARQHDTPVKTHDLGTYDQLSGDSDDEPTDH